MTRWLWRLQAWLNRRQYLSTACSAGDHESCRLMNTYTAQSCVCARCHHQPRLLSVEADCGPWLHTKNQPLPDGFEVDDFEYHDDFFGVRKELIDEAVAELRELGILGRYAVPPAVMRNVVWHVLERVLSTMVPRAGYTPPQAQKLPRLPEQKDRRGQ